MNSKFHKCYDDWGNLKDNALNIAFNLGKKEGLRKGKKIGRADALKIDMDKPMHFTDEQKAWVKNYIIINAERQRADAIDEYTCKSDCEYGGTCEMCVRWDKLADCYEPPKEKKE